jgi:hypothetical protein
MVTQIHLFESPDPTPLDFCLWCWMKSEVYKRRVDRGDKLSARILDAAPRTKRCEAQLRQTTRDLHTHELQSAMRLTVGFSNIYYEL